jgi:hypothetical protein
MVDREREEGGIFMVSEKVRAEHYNLNFGTNIIRNCNGTVIYRTRGGKQKELFILEKNLGELLLTTEIRQEDGELLARLRRNSFVFTKSGFDVEKHFELGRRSPDVFILRKKDDNKELFKARIIDSMNVQVTGVFYTDATKIEATDERLMIGTNTLVGNVIEGFGSAMLIEEGAFSIGVAKG